MSVHFRQTSWQSSDSYMCRPVPLTAPPPLTRYSLQPDLYLDSPSSILPKAAVQKPLLCPITGLPVYFSSSQSPLSLRFLCDASESSRQWNTPLSPGLWGEPRSHFIYSPKSQGSSPTVFGNSVFSVKCLPKGCQGCPALPECQSWLSMTTPMDWFTIKGHSSGTARRKRFVEQGIRRENPAAMPSLTLPLPRNLQVFTNLEALRSPWNSRLKRLASWVIPYLYLLPQILGSYCSQRPWNHLI